MTHQNWVSINKQPVSTDIQKAEDNRGNKEFHDVVIYY